VCEMWKNQYNKLCNKLESNKSMQDYYDQVNSSTGYQTRVITVDDDDDIMEEVSVLNCLCLLMTAGQPVQVQ